MCSLKKCLCASCPTLHFSTSHSCCLYMSCLSQCAKCTSVSPHSWKMSQLVLVPWRRLCISFCSHRHTAHRWGVKWNSKHKARLQADCLKEINSEFVLWNSYTSGFFSLLFFKPWSDCRIGCQFSARSASHSWRGCQSLLEASGNIYSISMWATEQHHSNSWKDAKVGLHGDWSLFVWKKYKALSVMCQKCSHWN